MHGNVFYMYNIYICKPISYLMYKRQMTPMIFEA